MAKSEGSIGSVSSQSEIQKLVEKIKKPTDIVVTDLGIEKQRRDDDVLWKSMRGIHGLWAMFFDAGILLAMASQMNEGVVEVEKQLALMLRVASVIAAIEGGFLAFFPRLPIPRFMARFAVNQYCELCAYVRAPMEWTLPSLVDRFDAVI